MTRAAVAALRLERPWRDLAMAAAGVLATLAVAIPSNAAERVHAWLHAHDRFGLSTLLLVVFVVAIAAAWYAVRRWRDHRDELAQRAGLEQRLRLAAEEAEAASHAKSEFLANMSHELRTPLNAILGFSEALAGGHFGALAPRQREYIRDIHASGQHLLRIINDVLDMAKLDAGRMTLAEEEVDLGAAIESCLRLVRDRAEQGQVQLVCEVPRHVPHLKGDELRIKQILLNLLSNAIKFTPPQGTVSVRAARIESGLALTVADTGIGMDETEIAVAMTPFAQVENSMTRKNVGTGLGLPIVNALVALHDGRLIVRSAKGAGTSITALFPATRLCAPAPAKSPHAIYAA